MGYCHLVTPGGHNAGLSMGQVNSTKHGIPAQYTAGNNVLKESVNSAGLMKNTVNSND